MSSIWVLDVPFQMRMVAQASGARWDKEAAAMVFHGDRLPAGLEVARAMPFTREWAAQHHLNGRFLEPLRLKMPRFVPRDHQEVAAAAMGKAWNAGAPGFLLADEVGTGKTLSAWHFACAHTDAESVLISTTASATAHWRHTILHYGWREGMRIEVINHERLGKLFALNGGGLSSTRRKGKLKRIAREGQAIAHDLFLVDESHKAKNPDSARGMMIRQLSEEAAFTGWLSATAGQSPLDLSYLHQLLGAASGSRVPGKKLDDFIDWCVRQGFQIERKAFGKIQWVPNEGDSKRIHGWLLDGRMGMRRRPQDIAGWPEMQRQMMPVELGPDAKMAFGQVWSDYSAAADAVSRMDPHKGRIARENNQMRLRQQASMLRLDNTQDVAATLLDKGRQVAISVAFRATQEAMAQRWRSLGIEPAMIHGDIDKKQAEAERMRFQTGQTPVVIFTVEEAISLHQGEYNDAERTMILHDVRWSAIQLAQIEGRCHRDGTLAPVIWMAAEGTVEMDIAQAMIDRVAGMKSMHGDPAGDLEAIGKILEMARARGVQAG